LNQELWDTWTPIHERSQFYDVAGFKAGKSTLKTIELEELGDISGKSLLHLQCHFGLDTLSWARLGARVTGIDFSDKAITLASALSSELGIDAKFACSNIYDLPRLLRGEFDIVFTSYGVLCWLPDLNAWAEVIARFLKPKGVFYMVEDHPLTNIYNNTDGTEELKATDSYFHAPEPVKWDTDGSYAFGEKDAKVYRSSYEWTHSLSDVLNALISAGLKLEFLHEFPVCAWRRFSFMEQDQSGWWRLQGDNIPLTFSIKATRD